MTIYVEIIETKGSTPRDVGTAMKVTIQGEAGTIGGGQLEFEAIKEARQILASGIHDDTIRTYPLGPSLGQCCGGAVTLRYTRSERPLDRQREHIHRTAPNTQQANHLWIWGAGHVGRAIVSAAHPQTFGITWIDTDASRFPQHVPAHVTAIPAADPTLLARKSPPSADHLILTYSHDLDFALCTELLGRGAASIGLIGSQTKRARFFNRLRALGLDPTHINCPIGDKSLGKRPDQIAQGFLSELSRRKAA